MSKQNPWNHPTQLSPTEESLINRIHELEAIVNRLPKTADSVPVLTGDTVFAAVVVGRANGTGQTGYGVQEHIVMAVPEHSSEPPSEWLAVWNISTGRSGPMVDLSGTTPICLTYSTRAAAETAAREDSP